jgi:uncharacterized protein YraI
VGSIPSGATVTIVGRNASSTWVFIEYADVRGWVATWIFTINGDLSSVPVLQSQDKSVSEYWPDVHDPAAMWTLAV